MLTQTNAQRFKSGATLSPKTFTTPAALALALGVFALAASAPQAEAAEQSTISVGSMYMASFHLDTDSNTLSWQNKDNYQQEGPQVLKPLSQTNPGDYYTASMPAAALLNPHAQGGLDAASSRFFGFSLSGDLRTFLTNNNYAFAIQLQSITFANTADSADNVSVFYYNGGNDDWGSENPAKTEWSELTASNYLTWNGQSFLNMLHPLVASSDDFSAEYTLNYAVFIVQNNIDADINATVLGSVTPVDAIPALTFSYNAQSHGATPVPEPATYALLLSTALGALVCIRRKCKGVQRG